MIVLNEIGSLITSGILVLTAAFLIRFIFGKYSFIQKAWRLPSLQPYHFLVGNLVAFWQNRDDIGKYLVSEAHRVGKQGIMTAWLFYHPMIFVTSWKHGKKILGNKKFLDRGWPSRKIAHGFVGLPTLANAEWKARRNLVAPSYVPSVLDSFVPTILYHTELMLNDLLATKCEPINALPIVSQHIISITLETSLGLKKGGGGDVRIRLKEALIYFLDSQFDRIFRFYTWNDQLLKVYHWIYGISDVREDGRKCARQIIEARIAERNTEAHEKRMDFKSGSGVRNQAFLDNMLDKFMQNSDAKSDGLEDLINESLVIIATSFDTLRSSTIWFLHNMAHNPDVQQKLYEELLDFDEKNENITISQINELTYLDQCVKENLRIYPPVANMVRMVDENITLDDNTIIPKGILSITFIYFIHHDEEIYPEPEKFNPSRFAPENIAKIPLDAYIPFGDGPRRCIGEPIAILEAKIIFSNIIKKFKIEPVEANTAEAQIDFLTRPKKQLKFKFIPRI